MFRHAQLHHCMALLNYEKLSWARSLKAVYQNQQAEDWERSLCAGRLKDICRTGEQDVKLMLRQVGIWWMHSFQTFHASCTLT